MPIATIAFLIMYVLFDFLYRYTANRLIEILSIALLMCFYYFAVRTVIAPIVSTIFYKCSDKLNYNNSFFREKKIEKPLYKILNVKRWKNKMITYNPDAYNIKNHTLDKIVLETCLSEIIHVVLIFLNFVPLLFAIHYGYFVVFLIASILMVCFEIMFIIIQRYNRPRLLKLMQKISHANITTVK